MRVCTAFNKILGLPGTQVVSVEFTDAGLVLDIRRRARVHRCPCGQRVRGRYDERQRVWRHLDFGAVRVQLRATIARVWCPHCRRVRTEQVPWARPGARFTRDFEDVIGWLAQRMDKTSVSRLMRTSWTSVDQAIRRVVADHLDQDRLDGLYRLGIDEISYKKGHHYLTVVADHDTGNVVWVARGRSHASLGEFFDAVGPQRLSQVEAVTMDGSRGFIGAVSQAIPAARICLDPFHVIQWATQALDAVFRAERMPFLTAALKAAKNRKPWDQARAALRRGREKLTPTHLKILRTIRRERRDLHRAWTLKEELRDLFRIIAGEHAADYLTRWIRRARRSRIRPFARLADRLENHHERIVNAVELGLSNSRLEGINAKIRVIQRRGYGHHHPDNLANSIYLCCAGIRIPLPTQT